jgi:hypothetical protein
MAGGEVGGSGVSGSLKLRWKEDGRIGEGISLRRKMRLSD